MRAVSVVLAQTTTCKTVDWVFTSSMVTVRRNEWHWNGAVRWSIIRRRALTLPYCVAELFSYL